MSIFNTIGRLTYKTQRVVTNGVANPLREMSEGYAQARAKQKCNWSQTYETSQQRLITGDVHSIPSIIHNLNP